MRQAEFENHVGQGNVCLSISDALERARIIYSELNQPNLLTLDASRGNPD
jgi:hypothetical protein